MGEQQEYRQLTREELNALAGEELPERAAMSLINANIAIPVNAAVAANVGEGSSRTHVSTRSRQRIVQRSGRTQVTHERTTGGGDDDEPAGGSRD